MTVPSLIWGAPDWIVPALGLLGVALLTLAYSYVRIGTSGAKRSVRVTASVLKAIGFTALLLSLLEPLLTGSRPRKGANAFVILADNSQSLQIKDDGSAEPRGE